MPTANGSGSGSGSRSSSSHGSSHPAQGRSTLHASATTAKPSNRMPGVLEREDAIDDSWRRHRSDSNSNEQRIRPGKAKFKVWFGLLVLDALARG
jgi:hypothetical protein